MRDENIFQFDMSVCSHDICFTDPSLSGNIMAMDQCLDILKSSFRLINEDICSYIQSVLETSGEDFESPDDLFEAVGEVLQEMDGEKSESEIQKICEVLYRIVKPGLDQATVGTGKLKLLETSVQLGQLAAEQHNGAEVGNAADSIWLKTGEEELRNVDKNKLERAEVTVMSDVDKWSGNLVVLQELLKKKQNRKENTVKQPGNKYGSREATASQVLSKGMMANGNNTTKDIFLENFDISYGEKVLISGANVTLAFGRR